MFINLYIARPTYHFILIYTCGLTVVIKRTCYVQYRQTASLSHIIPAPFPQNCPFSLEIWIPHLLHDSLNPNESSSPNGISIGFYQMRAAVNGATGAFWNSAIRPSVCPSVSLSHGAAA